MTAILDLPGFRLNLGGFLKFPSATPQTLIDYNSCHSKLVEKFEKKEVGFFDWPGAISPDLITNIQATAREIKSNYDAVLLVGIGGSYLGAAALIDALADPSHEPKLMIHWLSNVDRTSIDTTKRIFSNRKAACVLISKSGNTVETLSALYECHPLFDSKAFYVVTDPERGELRSLAKRFKWTSFPVPENIGGRYSVFTAVGLFPLELAGIDCAEVLKGAQLMREHLLAKSPMENPAYRYAAALYLWSAHFEKPIHVLMPYDSALARIGDWFVQLWAESVGKHRGKDPIGVGFTPIRCLGTLDQHSQLQLFKEGPPDKVAGFIELMDRGSAIPNGPYVSDTFRFLTKHSVQAINREALLAVEKSLNRSGMPTYRFIFPSLSAQAMGSFLFFQMVACAFAGELFEVNAFDQPGVEEAKELMRAAL